MKKIFTHLSVFLVFFTLSATVFAQTNTFPTTGNVGIGTLSPTGLFQVNGGTAQFGGLVNYAKFSIDGDLKFTGTGDYLVDAERYAFRYSANQNFGLLFSASNSRYEFRDGGAAPIFWITGGGNTYIKSKLAIGSTTTPGASLDITPANGAAIKINPFGEAAGNTGEIRFLELVANGTNYTGFKAPDNISGNKIWTLPSADGTAGQYLKTDGTGKLGWASDAVNAYTAGTGLLLTGTVFSNTAPDQTVTLTGGGVTTISGTYPNFTISTPATGGGITLTTIGSTPNANGASLTGSVLNLEPADATNGGVVTAGAQTFGGAKTFDADANINGLTVGRGGGNYELNIAIGQQALFSNTTGLDNIAIGNYALYNHTTGHSNTAIGYQALFSNTEGIQNTAIGLYALNSNTIGGSNTAIGQQALFSNTTGVYNTALGFQTLQHNTEGQQNTAIGTFALYLNTTGYSNAATGIAALYANTEGFNNTANGYNALKFNTFGNHNTATGYQALFYNTTGNFNTAIGVGALGLNITGHNNTAIGYDASVSANDLNNSTAIGAGAVVDASNKIQLGNGDVTNVNTSGTYTAGAVTYPNTDGTTGQVLTTNGAGAPTWATPSSGGVSAVTAISGSSDPNGATISGSDLTLTPADATNGGVVTAGAQTFGGAKTFDADATINGLTVGTGGSNQITNTTNGYAALFSNTIGYENSAFGYNALHSNTEGLRNTALGFKSLEANTTGNFNTANGYNALHTNTIGTGNTATGYEALSLTSSGIYNTANGCFVLTYNTTGNENTASGMLSLYNNVDGSSNTAFGYTALGNNSFGSNNTGLGAGANVSANDLNNATAIGAGAIVDASDKVSIGNSSVSSNGGQVNWTAYSDARIKDNVQENVPGIDFINQLRPVTYHYNVAKQNQLTGRADTMMWEGKYDIEKIQFSGFLAQEVDAAAKNIDYDFSGVDKSGEILGLRYAEFVVPLVKAVQELDATNKEKDAQIENLQFQIDELKALILSGSNGNSSSSNITLSEDKASSTIILNGAWLEQNVPNPFMGSTIIRCYIPEGFTSAEMVITAQNGVTLKRATLNQSGINEVTVDASAITSGAYQYTLIVDGNVIGTKQMILTK